MKKLLIGTAAVFVLFEVLDFLFHGVILASTYATLGNVFRPDMMSKMWIIYLVTLIVAFFFTLIFSKGFENKGVGEGLRYGFYAGMMLSVGYAYGSYAMIDIPYSLALQWFLYAMIEYLLAGVVLTFVYKPSGAQPAA